MYKIIIALILTSFLSGCSDAIPMKMTRNYQNYVGVWQYRSEKITDNSVKIDNMLLAINSDAAAVFRKCEFDEIKSTNSTSSKRFSTNLSTAVVTKIADKNITLVQAIGWFGIEYDVEIDKSPYQINGVWYINVEGKKLTRLTNQEVDTETNWECPDDNE